MIFGVLKDIKIGESRTICTPLQVASIVAAGHTVYVQSNAGAGAGFEDDKYVKEGATIVRDPAPPATVTKSNNFYQEVKL
jgi:alanine dehydrogenase